MSRSASPREVFVNGRFLTQRLSGVQRFGREIVRALDELLSAERPRSRWSLVAPTGTDCDLPLRTISFRTAGPFHGHLWEQTTLARIARHGVLVNTGNSAPVLHARKIVVLHDAAVFRTPENFGAVYGLLHRLFGRVLVRRAKIGTVSAFSRDELARALPIDRDDVFVVPNGWEHIARVSPDDGIVARLGLTSTRFFVILGNAAPNKNIGRAIEAFDRLSAPDARLVLVGAAGPGVFRASGAARSTEGVVAAGRLADAEIAGLLRQAVGLVFPSLYEGFGIPPLEAMAHRCPVVAADIPAVREVCRDAAAYFDPTSERSITVALEAALGRTRSQGPAIEAHGLRRFSWSQSARTLLHEIADLQTPRRPIVRA